jgi:hypothetical protein
MSLGLNRKGSPGVLSYCFCQALTIILGEPKLDPKNPKLDPYTNRYTLCNGSLPTAWGGLIQREEFAAIHYNSLPE